MNARYIWNTVHGYLPPGDQTNERKSEPRPEGIFQILQLSAHLTEGIYKQNLGLHLVPTGTVQNLQFALVGVVIEIRIHYPKVGAIDHLLCIKLGQVSVSVRRFYSIQ